MSPTAGSDGVAACVAGWAALDGVVATLAERDLTRETRCAGWDVADRTPPPA